MIKQVGAGHSREDAHQELALVEAQVGSLVELLPVALLVTSSGGIVLRANPAAAALLGRAGTLVGQAVEDTLVGHDLCVRIMVLGHDDDRVRLYVLQERDES